MNWSTRKVAVNGWAVIVASKHIATVTKHRDGFTVWDGPKPSKANADVTNASKQEADHAIECIVEAHEAAASA